MVTDDCGCAVGMMVALTPMHPCRYLDLACDAHRARFKATTPSRMLREYIPDDATREAAGGRAGPDSGGSG